MDRIIKGIGGFYYVRTASGIIECKARGAFRKNKISPLVGDFVKISINDRAENTIDEIIDRKNSLIRPPVANLDKLIIVSSICKPYPNTLIIDKIIAICERKGIEPIIVFNKNDLSPADKYADIYRNSGFKTIISSAVTGEGIDEIKSEIKGSTCAFTGNSGVGKTSLLNCIDSRLSLDTGEISDKLGRGRHTTRSSEIFEMFGGEVIDTPGFSSLDIDKCEIILKDDLQYCFREFDKYLCTCQFNSCAHIKEKGCSIIEAVKSGYIQKSRYDSYCALYEQVKDIKEWEIKKNN